jgi:branched-subunit amino acid ABC-type transport system permease component
MRRLRARRKKAGLKPVVSWVAGKDRQTSPYSSHRLLDVRSLAMHAVIARKIERDPALLAIARRNVERWGERWKESAPAWLGETTTIAGAHIPNDRWIEILTAIVVLFALNAFLRRTRYGLIIRAGVENRAMVTALGIDVRRAFTLVFAIGGVAAALAGVLSNVYFGTVDPQRGTSLLIFAFIVVVIGGLGSLRGTAAAAVVVGLVQQYANYYASSGLGDLSVVLLLGLVLLVRPRGLSGSFA